MAVQALIPIGMWVYRIGSALYKTRQAAVAARLVQAGGKLITKLPKPKPGGRPGDGAKDITPKNVNTVKQVDKIVGIKPGQGANVKTQILSDSKEQVQEDKKRLDDLRKKEEKNNKTRSSESRRQQSQVKVFPSAPPAVLKDLKETNKKLAADKKNKKILSSESRRQQSQVKEKPKAERPPATSPQPATKPRPVDKSASPGTRTPNKNVRPKLRPDASTKYNTVGEAQKAGQLYFYDSKTKEKKVAVTKEQLKKSGKSLTAWTNDEIKKRKTKLNKGGMMAKKSGYADGGMAMVMKNGKKVPAFAADGVGKMNMGGMAKKKPASKMMAGGMAKKKPAKMMGGGMTKSSGYMYGGMAKKKPAAKKK